MEAKIWYLAAGQKKVGPMATSRVLERVAQGKVPAEARVWRDGMTDWLPLSEVDEFKAESPVAVAEPAAAPVAKKNGLTKSGERARSDTKSDSKSDSKAELRTTAVVKTHKRTVVTRSSGRGDQPFVPPHRIVWWDLWRAFGLGLDRRRVAIVLLTVIGAVAVGGVIGFMGNLASKLHVLLALPFLLAAAVASFAVQAVGLGALSHHSRRQLEGAAAPTIGEAFGHAARHAGALTIAPIALSLAWLVPLVAMVLISLLVKIPYLGPVGTGALFGVHILLGATTLYLLLTAGIGSAFAPIVVGFESTGVVGTFRTLLDFARRSTVRVLLWSALPLMAMGPFAFAVFAVTALAVGLPLGSLTLMAGEDVRIWLALDMVGDCPLPGLEIGLLPMVLWVGLAGAAALAVVGSVGNSLLSLLYVGGREGNDERPTRDAVLAARAALKNEEN